MRVFLFLMSFCGLVTLATGNKKCDALEQKFKSCLSKGFKPKTLEGCKVGDGKPEKKDAKKCAKLEKVLIKKCKYSCQSDGEEEQDDSPGPSPQNEFVPVAGATYQLKKVGGPGNGMVVSASHKDRRNSVSYFPHLTSETAKRIPWTISKSTCDCDSCSCNCFKFTFRARVSCCQSWTFALAVHSDKRSNGNGVAIVHKSPWSPQDECWTTEPANGGYKLKKAHARQAGKYLVAGKARDGNTFFVEVTDDASAATVWDIAKL